MEQEHRVNLSSVPGVEQLRELKLDLTRFILYFSTKTLLVQVQNKAVSCLVAQSCLTLWHMDCSSPGSSVHRGFQARILSHTLLQGIFPIQGLNPGLPHCRWIIYQLSNHERLKTKLSHTDSINNDYTLQTDSNNLHKFCRKGRNVGNCRYFPQGLTKKISWLQRQEYTTIQEIWNLIYLKYIYYYIAIFKAIL